MKTYISLVMSGKFDGNYDCGINPKFGRNWFYWFPRFKNNRGKFWKGQVTDIGIIWLFWVLDLTIFGNATESEKPQQLKSN